MFSRWGAVAGLTLAAGVLFAPPAGAELTENDLGCSGSATISGTDGSTVEVTSDDTVVAVPKEGSIAWQGSIEEVTHNHFGEVVLEVGLLGVPVGDWGPSGNEGDEASATGTTEIPSVLAQVPPGKYVVSGFHQGDEGRCAGQVIVELDGSPLSTPAGIVALVGTGITGLGMVLSMLARGGAVAP